MDFSNMHTLAKRIDTQINVLESKVSNPMNMMYSDNSSQGVKVLSMLKGIIENLDNKKKDIEHMIQEENISWSGMVEDFNIVDKFKTEIVDNLNEIENMWTSRNPDYKPFKLPTTEDSPIKELNSIKDLNIQEEKQIGDQSFNDSLNNITMF